MNERIKRLMPKPWTFPYPDRELYTKEQMEKFAELIVANIIDQITIVKSNDEVVAVTLTDEENQIQKVIWEKQIGVQK